jgi:hypothetical protein
MECMTIEASPEGVAADEDDASLTRPSLRDEFDIAGGGPCMVLDGWERAYVRWMAEHGDQLRAVAHAVSDVSLQQFVHQLLASAVEAGWTGAEWTQDDTRP